MSNLLRIALVLTFHPLYWSRKLAMHSQRIIGSTQTSRDLLGARAFSLVFSRLNTLSSNWHLIIVACVLISHHKNLGFVLRQWIEEQKELGREKTLSPCEDVNLRSSDFMISWSTNEL